jgi:flagellar biogenesis protein FliO
MKKKSLFQKWLKNPNKREKLYVALWVGNIAFQLLLVLGFIIFIILMIRRY